MDGPRRLLVHELPALGKLVDTVFMNGIDGVMARAFPTLFDERNVDNLLVFSDGDEIVSHLGRTERWANLGGSLVRVGCVGAVATGEAHRGQNLAARLLKRGCAEAAACGVDFFLISGGRGLYRRAGAADVGLDYRAAVPLATAEGLAADAVGVRPFEDGDLGVWMTAYRQKVAHFVRTLEDWNCALQSRICQTYDSDFLTITHRGMPCGYVVCRVSEEDWVCRVLEYGGDALAVAGALQQVMERHDVKSLRMAVQGTDPILLQLLNGAGAAFEHIHISGTLLVLNFRQLIERLRPWFESVAGSEAAHSIQVRREGLGFAFTCGDESVELEDLMAATEFVFGHHERNRPTGVFAKLFPAPSLRYGLNFI